MNTEVFFLTDEQRRRVYGALERIQFPKGKLTKAARRSVAITLICNFFTEKYPVRQLLNNKLCSAVDKHDLRF